MPHPVMANLCEVMAEALRNSVDGRLPDKTDEKIAKAVMADAREYVGMISYGLACRTPCNASRGIRSSYVLLSIGRTKVFSRYVPEGGRSYSPGIEGCRFRVSNATLKLCAKLGATLGSIAEASQTLKELRGIDVSVWNLRRLSLFEGHRIYNATPKKSPLFDKSVAVCGKVYDVARTMVVSTDGTCVPCVKKDTQKVAGRNGDGAKSRELKIGMIGSYVYLGKNRTPIIHPSKRQYVVSYEGVEDIRVKLRSLAMQLDMGTSPRVQYIGDGADWVESIAKDSFPQAEFTIDFYHALSYLNTVCSYADSTNPQKLFKTVRRLMKRYGARCALDHIYRRYAHIKQCGDENLITALRYLEKRVNYMQYGRLRREGFLIGSGHIESACKSIVGSRCKLAGMHWRHKNAAYIAAIRAAIKSNTYWLA